MWGWAMSPFHWVGETVSVSCHLCHKREVFFPNLVQMATFGIYFTLRFASSNCYIGRIFFNQVHKEGAKSTTKAPAEKWRPNFWPTIPFSWPSHLSYKGEYPYDIVDGVGKEPLEDVPLAVDLPGVDLVEEGHHHEGVEDDGKVNAGRVPQPGAPAAVNIKQQLA